MVLLWSSSPNLEPWNGEDQMTERYENYTSVGALVHKASIAPVRVRSNIERRLTELRIEVGETPFEGGRRSRRRRAGPSSTARPAHWPGSCVS